jgi:hypothetical protein
LSPIRSIARAIRATRKANSRRTSSSPSRTAMANSADSTH